MAVRIDRIEVPDNIASKFELNNDGQLTGRAACTNIGVFTYIRPDGTIVRELRHPNEVFSKESMDSLKNIPLTLTHPNVVHPTDGIIGKTGENPVNGDNLYLSIDMTITDSSAIDAITNSGMRFLSAGYTCDVVHESGRWLGMGYDAVQKNIRYGHVAVVDSSRAGETAMIKLDSMDAVMVKEEKAMAENNFDELKTQFDEVRKRLDETNVKLSDINTKYDSLVAEKQKVEAERDTLKDRVDALEAENKELQAQKFDEEKIKAAVDRRVRIYDAAHKAEVDITDGMSEVDIQKAVILKVFPNAKLDSKDTVYIDARFDGAIEFMETKNDGATSALVGQPEPEVSDSKKARDKYIESLKRK